MNVRWLCLSLLAVPVRVCAADQECGSAIGAAVPDAQTARAIALAVIAARQPDITKQYVLEVEPDGSKGWIVSQGILPTGKLNGDMVVTAGGGGLGMHIDRCSGTISEAHYQR